MGKTTFIAAGDAFVTRRLPQGGYEGFQPLKALIEQHDVAFLNLESTFHDNECCPAAESGGTWAMSDPRTLDDMKQYGFNLFNTANNHSGDFGIEGVLATARNLRQRDMIFSGTGKDLGEASKPCYLEVKGTRVALISCCSSMSNSFRAGAQTGDMRGRPGLNPMRYTKIYHLDKEHFEMAQKVASASGINAAQEKSVRNGYSLPPKEGTLSFGGHSFVLDDRCWVESVPHKQDLKRIIDEIVEAKRQADVVLVSIHSHVLDGADNTKPALFLETFSKACIDAGASVIIGHGPHELQPIEKYKDGLILYLNGFVHNLHTAEELMEGTFFKLMVKKPRFREKYTFKTWLYTIGRNVALDHLRRNARQMLLSPEELALHRAEEYDLERAYLTEERKVILHRALDKIHPEYKQILWLIYFEELSSREAAAALGKTGRQAANLLYRAKSALRSQLEKEGFVYEEL